MRAEKCWHNSCLSRLGLDVCMRAVATFMYGRICYEKCGSQASPGSYTLRSSHDSCWNILGLTMVYVCMYVCMYIPRVTYSSNLLRGMQVLRPFHRLNGVEPSLLLAHIKRTHDGGTSDPTLTRKQWDFFFLPHSSICSGVLWR